MGYGLTEKDKDNPHNQVLRGNADFKVQGDRKCTDVLFMLMLIVAWIAMTGLGLIVIGVIPSDSLEPGDPRRLLNGIDYNHRICGVDSGVKERSKIYYLPSGQGVCVEECPTVTNYTQFICMDEIQAEIYNNVTGEVDVAQAWEQVAAGTCLYHMATTDILGYCVFDTVIDLADEAETAAAETETEAYLNDTGANYTVVYYTAVTSDVTSATWFEDLFADILTAKVLIGAFGLGAAAVLGAMYLLLLRIPGVLFGLIWGILWFLWALFGGGGVVLLKTSESWASEGEPRSHVDAEIKAVEYLGYALFGMCALWMLLMLWFRTRIRLAIAVTKEAARAVNNMKVLILFPVLQTTALLIFLIPWFTYALYLASSGQITTGTVETSVGGVVVKNFEYTENIRYTAFYLLFTYFWTSEFIVAVGQIVVAMAVATWYFTRDKGKIGNGTVSGAIRTSLFYHSGTAAFGSLIIAVIKTIRAVVAYIQKRAKGSSNKVMQVTVGVILCTTGLLAVLCCVQCCLWCLEKVMNFLNKNAYIQTAIFGYSFCTAAKRAFFLIARNIMRVAAVGVVSEIVLILGKVLIPMVSASAFYIIADLTMADELHGLVGITVVVFVISFFVATMFTEVFGMAISTILQCFIADEEMFKGDDRYGEGDLAAKLNKAAKEEKNGAKVAAVEAKPGGEDLP